ncbi:MAG: carboxypeptidase regulatory-like domain-containing protein [Thermoplasmatota archaeon]
MRQPGEGSWAPAPGTSKGGGPGPPGNRRGGKPRQGRLRLSRLASALFVVAFVLGVLNAASALLATVGVSSPGKVYGTGLCELAGEVRDTGGGAIPNATVTVTDASLAAVTDASGWYSIKGISPGVHRVEATAPGYNRMSVRLELRAGLLRGLDFTLERGAADASLDQLPSSSGADPGESALWTAPAMLALSLCALGAALLTWRGRPGKLALALGAASALSFGFLVGSTLAVAGTALAAISRIQPWPVAFKKRRGETTRPSAPEAPPAVECELVDDGGVEGEGRRGPAPADQRPEPGERRAAPGRLVTPRASAGALCCVCIREIRDGEERIRCVCGRTMHVRCVHEPECPECGHPFRKGA